MKGDNFGDRMKLLEGREAGRRCMPLLPIIARLDGKNFSRFTRGMQQPYDDGLMHLMQEVTKSLVEETGAKIGYTQSDEISLVFYSDNYRSQVFFDGRIQKMCSILASMTTAWFNGPSRDILLPSKVGSGSALFDCRVWTVPTKEEAANAILWRERDATKNAIQSAARMAFSHKECMNKNGAEMLEMLSRKGIDFNDYPSSFKRGSFFQRCLMVSVYSPEELENLPENHNARKNPNMDFERSEVRRLEVPPFDKVKNRVGVIFDGEEPEYE